MLDRWAFLAQKVGTTEEQWGEHWFASELVLDTVKAESACGQSNSQHCIAKLSALSSKTLDTHSAIGL